MREILWVVCGLTLSVLVMAFVLHKENKKILDKATELDGNNRRILLALIDKDETIDMAYQLVGTYEDLMEYDLEMLQLSLEIIEDNCSEDVLRKTECYDNLQFLIKHGTRNMEFLARVKSFG